MKLLVVLGGLDKDDVYTKMIVYVTSSLEGALAMKKICHDNCNLDISIEIESDVVPDEKMVDTVKATLDDQLPNFFDSLPLRNPYIDGKLH